MTEEKDVKKTENKTVARELVTKESLRDAAEALRKYKAGKQALEQRIINSEKWWKQRHWAEFHMKGNPNDIQPKSAWLFNVIIGKQADMMEAYPEPLILPREEGDKGEAEMLTEILPVVMQRNDFELTYSEAAWQKAKSGTAVYGVYWDSSKMNGLGDVVVKRVDLLGLFWEPGIKNIQESANVFHVEAVPVEKIKEKYPDLDIKAGMGGMRISEYIYDDAVPKDDKVAVVDWYYKKTVEIGNTDDNDVDRTESYRQIKTVLHYCKFVGDTILYSSENEGLENGWYDDGEYPFVFDKLFPVEGSLAGYGYIDIGKSTQEQIDMLGQALIKNALAGAHPRTIVSSGAGLNEAEYLDVTKPIVHYEGEMREGTFKPLETTPLGGEFVNYYNNLVEQLKFVTGNMDVVNGQTVSGVTAASAIAALQESAGRSSKSAIKSTYQAYERIIYKVISRIKQFYTAPRKFRILGRDGTEKYIWYDSAGLQGNELKDEFTGEAIGMKESVFDIEVRAQKQTAYTRLSQNELAVQMYQMGVFNPQMGDQATMMLEMMDFPGKDALMKKVAENHQNFINRQMMPRQLPPGVSTGAPTRNPWKTISDTGQPLMPDRGGAQSKMEAARMRAQQASQPS